jgi:hypothetical protein
MMHIVSYLNMLNNLSLYVCFTFQNNSCDGISKNIVRCNVLTPTWTPKQMDVQIINGMSVLWKMCNYNKW